MTNTREASIDQPAASERANVLPSPSCEAGTVFSDVLRGHYRYDSVETDRHARDERNSASHVQTIYSLTADGSSDDEISSAGVCGDTTMHLQVARFSRTHDTNSTGSWRSKQRDGSAGQSSPASSSIDPRSGRDQNVEESAYSVESSDYRSQPGQHCPTHGDFYTSRRTLFNSVLVLICATSTILSELFFLLASKGQRYGEYIGDRPQARLSPATAILWSSVVAKTIELSFVTSFVAFLGQAFSRAAFESQGRGVTLSELVMWRWVVQPGTLISNWQTVRYTGRSLLGGMTLLSAILSTLYVTASTAIVQPIPKLSRWHLRDMAGSVTTDFANLNYINRLCQSPVYTLDHENGTSICTSIENTGRSFYNLATFLSNWDDTAKRGSSSEDQDRRPGLSGLLYANSTIVPQWYDVVNTTEVSRMYGRVINNVSLAVPHIGVCNAVSDQRNQLPELESFGPLDAYVLSASVPSPIMNVLCAGVNETELAPIVFDAWNGETVDAATWTPDTLMAAATTTNATAVDDIFGWTKMDNETMMDYPPVFARYPGPFNIIMNGTSLSWGRSAIYLLGQGGHMDDGTNATGQYSVCKLTVDVSP